jgi:YjzC-like protein
MAKRTYKPGQTAPTSGQYKNTKTKTEVTVTKGEPLPPTPKAGQRYVLVDRTKHKK